jgi:hypothetical protein
MLLNIRNEESLRIRNKKFSSEWPFKALARSPGQKHFWRIFAIKEMPLATVYFLLYSTAEQTLTFEV